MGDVMIRGASIVAALLIGFGAQAVMAQAPQVRWQRLTDSSSEHAFTVEVPQGWQSSASLLRHGPVDIVYLATARSPDGTITLFLNDPDVPVFSLPNDLLAFGGFREGMQYSPGFGLVTIVGRYLTGDQFAVEWGRRRLARECQNVEVTQVRPLPEESTMLDFGFYTGGPQVSILAGDASFSCTARGAKQVGYLFAATTQVMMPGGYGIWTVGPVTGFVAPEARAGEAAELLIHLATSLRIDDDWAQRQGMTTMAVSRVVANANAAISKSISESFWYRRALEDKIFARDSQARRGVETYYDPVLREYHELDRGGYKWINAAGQIVTTTTADSPGPRFRRLEPAPPGAR
jgi:hypothetical protein